MRKNLLKSLEIFFILFLVLTGCSSNSNNKAGGSSTGGATALEITYASTADVAGLSPIDTNDQASSNVIGQVYETLFTLNPKTMEPEPFLAESYKNPDPNTWVIKLKKGIKFHDGTDFNAEAVKYTFEQIKDPNRAAPRASLLAPIDSIEVQDEYTIVIKTKEPYGPMLAALAHTNASIVSPTADKEGDINKSPVGTGPFKFVEWVPGDHITLTRNDDYWRDPAKLKTVTFKVVPEASTAISMLQTGDVQFIDAIQSDLVSRVKSLKNVNLKISEGTRVSYLGFNMEKAPFNELAFRQAVAYGIDQEAYVKQLNGLGEYNESIIGPKIFGYDEKAKDAGYPYDPEKAKQIVKEHGYSGTTITILVGNTGNYMKMAEIVQSQLSEIGLKVKIESMEWGSFLDAARAGNFEMTFLGWANSTGDGSELLYPNLHSDNIGSSNNVRYNNPEFDKLVDESRSTVDQEVRKQKLNEANIMVIKEAPMIVMEHGMVSIAYDKTVSGLTVDPTGLWNLYNVSRK